MANILLIDDSPSILHMVEQWLIAAGHRVTSRNSGLHIGRLLRTTNFDLVITDIYMPEVDGLQLLGLLRKEHRKLPCIAMSSAEGNLNFLGAAKQLGAVATLHKPFTEDALRAAVSAVLEPTAISTPVSKTSAS
jgi:DNA-binding NtrC family response regulator